MSLNLFTKTWANDYPWLKLCMTSVQKLCTEPISWTIVGDAGSKQDIEKIVGQAMQASERVLEYCKVYEVPELWPECSQIANGYLAQQWVKMNAHKVMGSGLFWNWDSDVIAVKPLSHKTFLGKSDRPIYWFSQFNSIMEGPDRPAHEARIAMLKEVTGLNEISFEFMRCMPVPMYGQILRIGSERREWQKSFELMKSGDGRFSEFNVIGQFSQLFFPDAYEWRNAESSGPTWSGGYVAGGEGSGVFQEHATIAQCWSWGKIPPHIEEFVNNLCKT